MKKEHLIAGNWIGSDTTFSSSPATGSPEEFSVGTAAMVDQAVKAAEQAFWSYSALTREKRAEFLNTIADEIEARAEQITPMAVGESGLPEMRINGERGRTTGQLKMFADHILKDGFLDKRFDEALPDRAPLPRPEMRMIQRPLGPVAVFGASNFPLAFSVAGGDTASALAAGCPVVVKGHPAHPGTSALIAETINAAIAKCELDPGVFSMIHSGPAHDVGAALVQHPLIKAVGFTGSLAGGRALFDLCAAREEPIPFFGELGSINPVFILPNALKERAAAIGEGWAGSLTMGAGQFCTNPGVVLVEDNQFADVFSAAASKALSEQSAQTMLTDGIAAAYQNGLSAVKETAGVTELYASTSEGRTASPNIFETTADNWRNNAALSHEVFGPLGIVIRVKDVDEMRELALELDGQLTCTLQMDSSDKDDAAKLLPVLERKAGRILANGFPTGVEVCDTMVHGGPYPASTNFGATSVGSLAIRRFLRPVCYQNISEDLLSDIFA